MDLKHYRNKLIGNDDERAVSPVIGVILMVAITVILAAVIAAFVLDIGDLDDSAPNAQFDWEVTDTNAEGNAIEVTVSHQSGDNIDLTDISASVEGDDGSGSADFTDGEFTAGDDIIFVTDGDNVDLHDTDGSGELEGDGITEIVSGGEDEEEIESVSLTWSGDGSSTVLTEYDT